jgi:DNA modification methylase
MGSETFLDGRVTMLLGDVRAMLKTLPDDHFDCVVTSPPYFGLRDYGSDKQIGLEPTPDAFVAELVSVFREVKRALRGDGSLWLNLGDSYVQNPSTSKMPRSSQGNGSGAFNIGDDGDMMERRMSGRANAATPLIRSGLKKKDLIGIPWRVAFALQADGWWLRSAIVWAKPNGMPGSQEDRCTSSYEMIFHMSKSADYWSDFDAIKTPPRESTLVRTAQDIQAQAGSHRANGGAKTNGTMKAVGGAAKTDKQRGHSRQHAGFNARWDEMERAEQMARPSMMRDVWFVSPSGFPGAHFAVMPEEIARRCIEAGCRPGGHVLEPFGGAGTSALVATQLGRKATLIELNPEYATLARARIEAAFMGKEEGSRHMVKQLGKDKMPFGPDYLFAGIQGQAAE